MDIQEKISFLQRVYKDLAHEKLAEIAELSRISSYPADYLLCHEGAYEDILYIIVDGNVCVFQDIVDTKNEHTLRLGGAGDVIGEMALIQNAPRSASVRTTTECTMLEMNRKDFEIILAKQPHIALDLIGITLDRMRENDKRVISELQRTNQVLRQMDRNKMEFIQVAAHELRTPLTVVKGYVDILQAALDTPTVARLGNILAGIRSGAERMYETVNTMLDITRLDSEDLKIAFLPLPVKQVLEKALYTLKDAALARNIALRMDYQADTPNIKADPALIEKALYHLLVNAIKYTPDGGKITLGVQYVHPDESHAGVRFSVQDTGIGLDYEHHQLVFEKFYQVTGVANHSSGKTTFKGGGSGLGLAIVRGIAKAHGGRTWLESDGHDEENFPGCTFYLEIPVN